MTPNLPLILLVMTIGVLSGVGIYTVFVPNEPEVVQYCPPAGKTGTIVSMDKIHSGKSTYYHITVGYEHNGEKQLCRGSVDNGFYNYFKEGDTVRPVARLLER